MDRAGTHAPRRPVSAAAHHANVQLRRQELLGALRAKEVEHLLQTRRALLSRHRTPHIAPRPRPHAPSPGLAHARTALQKPLCRHTWILTKLLDFI